MMRSPSRQNTTHHNPSGIAPLCAGCLGSICVARAVFCSNVLHLPTKSLHEPVVSPHTPLCRRLAAMRVVRSRTAGAGPRSRAGFPSGPGRLPSEGGGHLTVHPALFRLSSAVPRPAVGSGTRVSAVQPFQPYVPPRRGASTSLPPSLAARSTWSADGH